MHRNHDRTWKASVERGKSKTLTSSTCTRDAVDVDALKPMQRAEEPCCRVKEPGGVVDEKSRTMDEKVDAK